MMIVEKLLIGKIYMTEYIFKTIIVGDSGVGKTTLLYKYLYGEYISQYSSTIGVNYVSKKIVITNDTKIKIQIWDTAGQERFRSIIQSYFRNASGCIVAYDVTNANSFQNCSYWITKVINENPNIKILLLGTKNDLIDYRTISFNTGRRFAEEKNIPFYETSAKITEDIDYIFEKLSCEILEHYLKDKCDEKPGVINMVKEKYMEIDNNQRAGRCCY